MPDRGLPLENSWMAKAKSSRAGTEPVLVDDLVGIAEHEIAQLSEVELAQALHVLGEERERLVAQLDTVDKTIERVGLQLAARGHGG